MNMRYDEADLQGTSAFLTQNNLTELRQDASIWTAEQLNHIKRRTYEKKFPPMSGDILVPQSTETPRYAKTITYKVYSEFGMAKVIANYADDLPRVDVAAEEVTVNVKRIGDSYGYNIDELEASIGTGDMLPARKATAARKGINIKLNAIMMIGDAQYGLYGIMTHPNIGTTVITGGWSATADPVDMLNDVNAIYNAVVEQSNGVHKPNVIALPAGKLAILQNARLPDSGGKTVYTFFMDNHPGVRFVEVPEFKGAGTGNTDVIMAYERSEENLEHELVQDFEQLPAQARNLELVVDCTAKSGGVSVYYPLAFTKAEGI